jgi:hypothetical protein
MHLGKIKTKSSYSPIIVGFALVVVALVATVIYFSFTRATVSITPKALGQNVSFIAHVDKKPNLDPTKIETISGRIIAKESESEKIVTNVSEKTLEQNATGTVRLYNNTDKAQPLLIHTQLQAPNGVIFRTNSRVSVPANGSISVGVTADVKGADGNIGPSHFAIIKLFKGLQEKIYGQSESAMTGGIQKVQVLTDQDIEQAKNSKANELYDDLVTKIRADLQSNEKLVDGAVKKEILEATPNVAAGTKTTSFSIKVRARVTAVVFDQASLFDLAVSKLKSQLSAGRDLVNPSTENLSYTVASYDLNAGVADLAVKFAGVTIVKLSNEIFDKSKIFGFTKQQTVDYFLRFPDIDKVDVGITPFWSTKIPNLEDKIEISIANNIPLPSTK